MTKQSTTQPRQRCRHLQPSGHQCPSAALNGHRDCYVHGSDRRRRGNVSQAPAVIEIPLLDNRAAIQAVCTDLARALAAGTIDLKIAHEIGVLVRLALATLPPLPRPRARKDDPSADSEAVAEVILTPEGEEIAPEAPYTSPEDTKEPEWSFAEYLYRKTYPEKASEPLPPEGYVDPEKGSIIPPSQPQHEPHTNGGNMSGEAEITGPAQPGQQPKPGILPELNAVATPFRHRKMRRKGCPTPASAGLTPAAKRMELITADQRVQPTIVKGKLEECALHPAS